MQANQKIQSDQYNFPYHHLVDVTEPTPRFRRHLGWGFEYALYQTFIRDHIIAKGYNNVLDVGCGDGWMVRELHRHQVQAMGIDTDARAIQLAQAFCPDAELITGNVLDLNRNFEAVTLLEVLEHIPSGLECDILEKTWNLITPGGSLYVLVPSTARDVHKKHFRHYDRKMLEMLLRDAGVKSDEMEVRFLCQETVLYRFFLKLTNNQKCSFHIPVLDSAIWKHYRRSALEADEQNGLHICLIARKPA